MCKELSTGWAYARQVLVNYQGRGWAGAWNARISGQVCNMITPGVARDDQLHHRRSPGLKWRSQSTSRFRWLVSALGAVQASGGSLDKTVQNRHRVPCKVCKKAQLAQTSQDTMVWVCRSATSTNISWSHFAGIALQDRCMGSCNEPYKDKRSHDICRTNHNRVRS